MAGFGRRSGHRLVEAGRAQSDLVRARGWACRCVRRGRPRASFLVAQDAPSAHCCRAPRCYRAPAPHGCPGCSM
eukprot:5645936-Prymnesium_polylepis.1